MSDESHWWCNSHAGERCRRAVEAELKAKLSLEARRLDWILAYGIQFQRRPVESREQLDKLIMYTHIRDDVLGGGDE